MKYTAILYKFDEKNLNGRTYKSEDAEKIVELIKETESYGCPLNDVNSFDIDLDKISHKVTNVRYVKDTNVIKCDIELLDTQNGKILKDICDGGLPLYAIACGAGEIENDGIANISKFCQVALSNEPGGFGEETKLVVENDDMLYKKKYEENNKNEE